MNERIKELMDESVRFHWDHDGQAYEAQVHPEDLEYFAELIVRECALIAFHNTVNLASIADAEDVEANIKEHFGVEE